VATVLAEAGSGAELKRLELLHEQTILPNHQLLPGVDQSDSVVLTLIRHAGFRDLFKTALLRAIVDCGFERMSDTQQACLPHAVMGNDVLCQAKSGRGKTASFILACLQQVDASEKVVKVLVIVPTRELAYAIKYEFDRFAKHLQDVKASAVSGGTPIVKDLDMLKMHCPHVLVGTSSRLLQLLREQTLKLDKLTQFVVDECDRCLDRLDMRKDVQRIFSQTPQQKQVMMFSAKLSPDCRKICKEFMRDPCDILSDE